MSQFEHSFDGLQTADAVARATARSLNLVPRLLTDIFETPEGLNLLVDVAGSKSKDISLTMDGANVYVVAVARLQDSSPAPGDGDLVYKERSEAAASRVYAVNANVFSYDTSTSKISSGLLHIFMPRVGNPLSGSGAKREILVGGPA